MMFGMSFPAFTLAVLVFIALCAFLGYMLPRLSGDDGRRPIEDSARLSLGPQRTRAVIGGIVFFFPAFLLSLPFTVTWAIHQWPGEGQAVFAAFWPSVGIALISAICRCIYLLMKVNVDNESAKKKFSR
jgi:hypothetical protein